MKNSKLIRSLWCLLIVAIAAVVAELSIASFFVEAKPVSLSLEEIEEQSDSEEDGGDTNTSDLFAGFDSGIPQVSVFGIVRGDYSPLNHDCGFLIGHLERGPPVSASACRVA
jgi:hypothetical protein